MILKINTEEIEKEIQPFEVSVMHYISNGVLKDGRPYQIQLVVTTDEDEFIDEKQ